MRPTQVLLGGGRRFFYPKHVWTPAGGYWNHNPPGARKSLPYILAFWVGSTFLVYNIGTENATFYTQRAENPIPEQYYCSENTVHEQDED